MTDKNWNVKSVRNFLRRIPGQLTLSPLLRSCLSGVGGSGWPVLVNLALAVILTSISFTLLNGLYRDDIANLQQFKPLQAEDQIRISQLATGARASLNEQELALKPDFGLWVLPAQYRKHPVRFEELQKMRALLLEARSWPRRDKVFQGPNKETSLYVRELQLQLRLLHLEVRRSPAGQLPDEVSREISDLKADIQSLSPSSESWGETKISELEKRWSELLGRNPPLLSKEQLPAENKIREFQKSLDSLVLGPEKPGRYLSFVWYPKEKTQSDRYCFVMEVRASSTCSELQLVARFYFYNYGQEARDPDHLLRLEIGASNPHEIPILKQATPTWMGIRPLTIHLSEEQLASRFYPEMEKLARGAALGKLSLRDRIEREQIQAYTQRVLLERFGKAGSSGNDPQPLQSWTTWARRLNGKGFWASIQFSLVTLFWMLILALFCHNFLLSLQWNDLKEITTRYDVVKDRCAIELAQKSIEQLNGSRERIRARQHSDWYTNWMPRAVSFRFFHALFPDLDDLKCRQILDSECEHASEVMEGRLQMIRYLNWVIPSLGFIGTVIGISEALIDASGVLSANKAVREAVIQQMSTSLGIAFDTTFLALVLVIFTTLGYYVLVSRMDNLIQATKTSLMRILERVVQEQRCQELLQEFQANCRERKISVGAIARLIAQLSDLVPPEKQEALQNLREGLPQIEKEEGDPTDLLIPEEKIPEITKSLVALFPTSLRSPG